LTDAGFLNVAEFGSPGSFTVENGGLASITQDLTIGFGPNALGTVTVDATGSQLNVRGNINLSLNGALGSVCRQWRLGERQRRCQ
jgi:T5SS/PEP-CTERM-associated repeat protein